MSLYKHILLAIDLTDESDQLISKVKLLAQTTKAELSMIHVIEPLSFAYGGDVPMDLTAIQTQLDEHAQSKMESYRKQLEYPVKQCHVVSGHTETEVHRVADENQCDLIIVGSHGRHGLALLLGSTANGILHGAKCDVLAIRVNNEG